MKIGTKLSLFITIIITLVIGGISFLVLFTEKEQIVKQEQEKQVGIIRGLAQVGRESIYRDDDLFLINYVKLVKGINDTVVYAIVVDKDNRIISHSEPGMIYSIINDPGGLRASSSPDMISQSITLKDGTEVVELALPIRIKDSRAGTVRMGFSREKIESIIIEKQEVYKDQILVLAAAFAVGLLGALVIAFTMTNPIKKLVRGAVEIGGGNLDVKIKVRGRNELSWLADEFNEMGEKLKELDQMKRDFTASVTHELRSPLVAIEAYVNEMIRGGEEGYKKSGIDDLNIVKNNVVRLGSFINDLLDAAKIESASMSVEKRKVELGPVIRDVASLFSRVCEAKDIKLVAGVKADLPGLSMDVNRIRQVLTNLVSNAIKFESSGGTITVSAGKFESDKSFVEITVRDTGKGIPEAELKKVFEKFRQVEGVRNFVKETKGTGLGLFIVKSIVELHGGSVWVESKEGEGSAFHFTLSIEA